MHDVDQVLAVVEQSRDFVALEQVAFAFVVSPLKPTLPVEPPSDKFELFMSVVPVGID